MAASKPVALCTQLMPSGKLCRGIALKNQRYCHAHIRNHRLAERQRAELAALDRFAEQVEAMDMSELLHTLHCRLEQLYLAYNISRFPELRCLLNQTMERVAELKSLESNADPQIQTPAGSGKKKFAGRAHYHDPCFPPYHHTSPSVVVSWWLDGDAGLLVTK